ELSITQGVAVGNRCNALFDDARKALKMRISEEGRSVAAAAQMGRNVVITTGIVGGVISLVLAVVTICSITKPVKHGVDVCEAIAAGDLTRRLNFDRRDEIGRFGAASDKMASALCQVVTQIRAVAGRLGDSAGSLAKVSNDLLSQSHEMTTQAES